MQTSAIAAQHFLPPAICAQSAAEIIYKMWNAPEKSVVFDTIISLQEKKFCQYFLGVLYFWPKIGARS